jgi:hypothetical protein
VGVRRTISKLLNCDVNAFLDFNDVNGLNDLNEQMINVRCVTGAPTKKLGTERSDASAKKRTVISGCRHYKKYFDTFI